MSRPYAVLATILAVYLGLGILYARRTPLWQVPDEPAHFNYVAQVATTPLDPPEIQPGDYPYDYLEQLKARRFPPHMPVAGIAYEDHQPPAYYYLAAAVYRLAGPSDRDRVTALRLLGVLLGAATVWLAWRVPALVWSGSLPLATAAFVAFLPMNLTMTAAVNNDPLAHLVAAAVLAVAVQRALGHTARRQFILGGGSLLGLAFLTKLTVYGPAIVLLVMAEALRRRPSDGRSKVVTVLALLGLGLLIATPWLVRNIQQYGPADPLGLAAHDAVVADQPRTADWVARYGTAGVLRRLVVFTFDSFWGVFGWMGVFLDRRIYLSLAAVSAAAGLGLADYLVGLARRRREANDQWCTVLLGVAAILAAGAQFAGYNLTFVQHQGRYLFPALVPIAMLYLLGLRQVTWRATELSVLAALRRPLAWAVLLGFGAGLAILALLALTRYIVPGLS